MIKVQNGIAVREPIPAFLHGLHPHSLADLSWTDPRLGVHDSAWWPEERVEEPLKEGERYISERLEPDFIRQVVVCTWQVEQDPDYVPLTEALNTQFSVLVFRQRFTLAEQVAIKQATITDVEVGLVYDNFLAAQFIDVEDARVEQGLDLYIAKGLLKAQRKKELLAPELIT